MAMAALPIAAAAVSALGSVMKGNAEAENQKAQSGAHIYNADRLDENAAIAYQQSGAREDASRRRARQILGGQRAAFAQSGIDPTSGSAALVQEQSADDAEIDALTIRYEGNIQARGLRAQAEQERYAGRVALKNARSARVSGYLSAVGSALSAAAGRMGPSTMPGEGGGPNMAQGIKLRWGG